MTAVRTATPVRMFRRLAVAVCGVLCLAAIPTSPVHATEAAETGGGLLTATRAADFLDEAASGDARDTADWIVRTGDNQGRPFIIVDKKATKIFVFDGRARLRGATIALLGLAVGDDSAPGVGDRKLSDIPPEDRTTPAGRFDASFGLNLAGQDVLWIDYDTALALHRVLASGTRQHRLERQAAQSAGSRRITFGCINVPVRFYEEIVQPEFQGTVGIVYILPEAKPVHEVFPGVRASL